MDYVTLLESRFNGLQEMMEVMKYETQRDMVIMEKLDFVMMKWGEQERDRKEKGNSSVTPEHTMNSDVPIRTQGLAKEQRDGCAVTTFGDAGI